MVQSVKRPVTYTRPLNQSGLKGSPACLCGAASIAQMIESLNFYACLPAHSGPELEKSTFQSHSRFEYYISRQRPGTSNGSLRRSMVSHATFATKSLA